VVSRTMYAIRTTRSARCPTGRCMAAKLAASPRSETARGQRAGILAKRNTPEKAHKFKHLQPPSRRVTKKQLGATRVTTPDSRGDKTVLHHRLLSPAPGPHRPQRSRSAISRSDRRL